MRRSLAWPDLPLEEWKDTCATLHMWTQIAGKIRMALSPRMNHWWQVTLYVNARGLTTSPVPFDGGIFEIQFDFVDHNLIIQTSDGSVRTLQLAPRSVADFHDELMTTLRSLGIDARILTMPAEVPEPIPFDHDHTHASYDPEYANRFWRVLVSVDAVFKEFRARFIGKCSPVHFFWGGFDLAVSRFSGRRVPVREDADPMTREAYSHECISAGWWPGSGTIQYPAFFSYTAPEPAGFSREPVRPESAFYSSDLPMFLLKYDDVRQAPSPETALLEFLQSTYEAGARLARWDREELERAPIPSNSSNSA